MHADDLLEHLYTVTGLIKRNGTLAEANTYDAHGRVQQWGYRDFDFNRDGDVDATDANVENDLVINGGSGVPTADPMGDWDMDGDVDSTDQSHLTQTVSGTPPITLLTSALGNPYHFTGRSLFFYEDDPSSGGSPTTNKQIQYSRARWYKPEDGRWMQRDPVGYLDGLNLFEYISSEPMTQVDPFGLCPPCIVGGAANGSISLAEAASALGISIPQLQALIAAGKITAAIVAAQVATDAIVDTWRKRLPDPDCCKCGAKVVPMMNEFKNLITPGANWKTTTWANHLEAAWHQATVGLAAHTATLNAARAALGFPPVTRANHLQEVKNMCARLKTYLKQLQGCLDKPACEKQRYTVYRPLIATVTPVRKECDWLQSKPILP